MPIDGGAAAGAALLACGFEAGVGAFADQVAFELGECAERVHGWTSRAGPDPLHLLPPYGETETTCHGNGCIENPWRYTANTKTRPGCTRSGNATSPQSLAAGPKPTPPTTASTPAHPVSPTLCRLFGFMRVSRW